MSSRGDDRQENSGKARSRSTKAEEDSLSDSEEEQKRRRGRKHGGREGDKQRKSKKRRRDEEEESDESEEDSSSSQESEDRDHEKKRKERKKRRREEKEDRRKRRKEREREKDERKKRRSRDDDGSDEEKRRKKKLLKQAKKFLEKHEKRPAMVPVGASVQIEKISEADYFNKNQELATWLREQRGLFFSALSSEESREQFRHFVALWNGRQLSDKYYKGIDKAPRTGHSWSIRGAEAAVDPLDDEARRAARQLAEGRERRHFRQEQKAELEEMLPKATGREALLEKKAARREASKAREWSPEPMGERDVMGGGDGFQARLARERAWREKKASVRANTMMEKRAVFQEKESAKMDQLKALVNMAGGRITIPKRSDPPP